MSYLKYFAVSIALVSILLLDRSVSAQSILTNMDREQDSPVQYSLLPLAGYTSDIGLFGGGLFQKINYGQPPQSPFRSRLQVDFIGSFKGELQAQAVHEHTRAFNGRIRSRVSLFLFSSQISHFFGIGNQAAYSEELYSEDYFFYRHRNVSFRWRLRKKVAEYGFNGSLEIFSDLRAAYHKTNSLDENSRFAAFQLSGDKSTGWTNMLGLGLIADDRDSEFNPTEGYRYEAGVAVSDPLLASEFSFTSVWGELRNYVELLPNVVLAHKLRGEIISGNPPFWELSTLGNKAGLRGYHLDRFRGDRSIINIFELRTWLFSILDEQIRFGGQLFWDSGRVFSDNDSAGLFNNWQHTFGIGGAVSLFNPDFIITGDLGFSEETFRIYAGIGYNF
ncbi:MAG: BamA/TamA family outer membrane protein [Balneolaceae bacterium]|nr:BamA/TamA family outer membrane protein [Balneolaceae bacterium]